MTWSQSQKMDELKLSSYWCVCVKIKNKYHTIPLDKKRTLGLQYRGNSVIVLLLAWKKAKKGRT